MQMFSILPWTATPESCPFLCLGWCSPGLNVWTLSEVEYLWIPWYSCMLAGWIDAESQKNREKEVGIEGQMKRQMIGVGGLLFLQPVVCGYCAITVGLVWVLYYCTIWRIVIYCVWKEHFYPSLILYQVLKNLKAFQPKYWTVFKGPMACHCFRLNCLCVLFICMDFYHVRKCYIDLQGEQGRENGQKLAK